MITEDETDALLAPPTAAAARLAATAWCSAAPLARTNGAVLEDAPEESAVRVAEEEAVEREGDWDLHVGPGQEAVGVPALLVGIGGCGGCWRTALQLRVVEQDSELGTFDLFISLRIVGVPNSPPPGPEKIHTQKRSNSSTSPI